MKSLALAVALIGGAAGSQAALATWGFGTGSDTTPPLAADSFSGFSSATISSSVPLAWQTVTGGRLVLAPQAGNDSLNGTSIILALQPQTALQLTSFTFECTRVDARHSPESIAWFYRQGDIGSWTKIGPTSIAPGTLGFSSLSLNMDGGAQFYIKGQLSGTVSGKGALAFDNFNVSTVPEPVNIALAGFGLLAAGGAFGRKFFKKTASQ